MTAKDTVKQQIYPVTNSEHLKQLQEQAEISFKAGQQDQAALDQINFDKERLEFWDKIAKADKAGMQKVVDYLNKIYIARNHKEYVDWQSFLKENGL